MKRTGRSGRVFGLAGLFSHKSVFGEPFCLFALWTSTRLKYPPFWNLLELTIGSSREERVESTSIMNSFRTIAIRCLLAGIFLGCITGSRFAIGQNSTGDINEFLKSIGQSGGTNATSPKPSDSISTTEKAKPSASGETVNDKVTFVEKNFEIRGLPKDWERVDDPKSINPAATVIFKSDFGQFTVVAEPIPKGKPLNSAEIRNRLKNHLRTLSWVSELRDDSKRLLRDLIFETTGFDEQGTSAKVTCGAACLVHDGFAYQLTLEAKGMSSRQFSLLEEDVFNTFVILSSYAPATAADRSSITGSMYKTKAKAASPSRGPTPPSNVLVQQLESKAFGVKIDWTNTKWSIWSGIHQNHPLAECGGLYENDAASVCYALNIRGKSLPDEWINALFLTQFGIQLAGNKELTQESISDGSFRGSEFTTSKILGGGLRCRFKLRIVRDQERALCIAAWCDQKNPSGDQIIRSAIAGYKLLPKYETGKEFETEESQQRRAILLKFLAAFAFREAAYTKSADLIAETLRIMPVDADGLLLAADAFTQASRFEEGIKVVEASIRKLPHNEDLNYRYAILLHRGGKEDDAIKVFEAEFKRGRRSDDHFLLFIDMLRGRKETKSAIDHVERYRKRGDSPALLIAHAQMLIDDKQGLKAVEILEARKSQIMSYVAIAAIYVDALAAASRKEDAYEELKKLMKRRGADASALYTRKANLELELGHTSQARQTLEEALEKYPQDESLRTGLTYASSLLGKGKNDSIKRKLDLVPLPKGIDFGKGDSLPAINSNSENGAVYLHRHVAIEMNPNRPIRRTLYDEVFIIDQRGVESFPSLGFTFDPNNERIYVHELKVFNKEREIIYEGDVENYYTTDANSEMATYKKLLNVPVSGLKPGCRIVCVVTTEDLQPSVECRFRARVFAASEAIESSSLTIYSDPKRFRFWKSDSVKLTQGQGITTFSVQQVAGVPNEKLQPNLSEFCPMVVIGPVDRTWQDVGDDYLKIVEERLGHEADVKSLAAKVVASGKTDMEKIELLAEYVRQNITYQAIEFGRRGYIMEPTNQILKNGFGDCKDHSLLLHDLLLSQGIIANLALVNTSGKVYNEFPSLDQFDHVIVVATGPSGPIFMDCTNKYAPPLDSVTWNLANKDVLLLSKGNSRLVRIPEPKTTGIQFASEQQAQLDGGFDLKIQDVVEMRYGMAHSFRAFFAGAPAGTEKRMIQSMLTTVEPRIQVQKLRVLNLDRVQEPLKIELEYLVPRAVKADANVRSQTVRRPGLWEKYFFSVDYLSKRHTPFEWENEFQFQAITRMNSEPSRALVSEAITRKENNEFFDWELKTGSDEKSFEIITNARRKPGLRPAEKYAQCYEEMEKFDQSVDVELKVQWK
jgi:tetratricopeptide (TPR) repeat protein